MSKSISEDDFDTPSRYETNLGLDETISTYQSPLIETFQPTGSEDVEDEELQPLSVQDLLNRFEVFKDRIIQLDQGIEERKELTGDFLSQTQKELDSFQFQLKEHRSTWKQIGMNPSADRRRNFLEERVTELVEKMYQISLDHFQNIERLEREKFDLLPDYLQLKRVAESVD